MNNASITMPTQADIPVVDLIDELPLPYIEMDASGIITRANRATLALHPPEQGPLVGKMAWDLMTTEEKEPSCAAYLSLMESGDDPPVVTRSIYTRSGQFRIWDLHRSLILDKDGRPAGMRAICVDVTEAKKQLNDAHRSRMWLESMLFSVSESVIVTDALGFVRAVNPSLEKLFGWKASEVMGKPIEKAFPLLTYESYSKVRLSFNMTLEGHTRGIATMLDRQRRELRVEISTSPIIDKGNGYTSGVVNVLHQLPSAD
jgi:PAS domain S-box-containing protein